MDEEVRPTRPRSRLIGLRAPYRGEHVRDDDLVGIVGDMSRCPTPGTRRLGWPLPRPDESAGKKPVRLRKGAHAEDDAVQCAWAAKRKKDSYYKPQFFRLAKQAWTGRKPSCAVAASILTAIYHILKNGTEHHDLGADHFNRRSTEGKPSAWLPSSQDLASRFNFNAPPRPLMP